MLKKSEAIVKKRNITTIENKLEINEISVTESFDSAHAAVVRIDYTITDNVFSSEDFVIINI